MNAYTLATIDTDAIIHSDFGILSLTLLVGMFFYVSVQFRSPIGVVFSGLTSLTMVGWFSGFTGVDSVFISVFVTVIILTLAAIHSVG